MRAAPGFSPRAIARLSRRIDIAKTLFDGVPRVAENGELRVNPGAVDVLVMARCGPGKWLPGGPISRICLPICVPAAARDGAVDS